MRPWRGQVSRFSVSIDLVFRRYFAAAICTLVAIVAYFQALGISHLIGAELATASGPTFPPAAPPPVAAISHPRALAIHERNPFDHVTGSLIGKDLPDEAPKAPVFTDPLTVPACPGVKVHILSEADDPFWSVAALSGNGEAKPIVRRVGDALGSHTVAYIGYNPTTASPTVWLESGADLCQANLFGIVPPVPAAAPAPTAAAEPAPAAPSGKVQPVDPDIASKIRKISETEFEVDRSAIDKILENQAALMASARIVPEQKDGKVIGVRLFGIRDETLLGKLGMKNGDRLETINGFAMGSPEKALEAYARLRTANNLTVTLNRRGAPTTIEMKIK